MHHASWRRADGFRVAATCGPHLDRFPALFATNCPECGIHCGGPVADEVCRCAAGAPAASRGLVSSADATATHPPPRRAGRICGVTSRLQLEKSEANAFGHLVSRGAVGGTRGGSGKRLAHGDRLGRRARI